MNIILNHTLRSVRNNRTQIAIIVTTIAVVTVMIFAALSLTGLFYNININAQSRLAGDTDIAMRGEELFPLAKVDSFAEEYSDKIEYVDSYLQTAGLAQTYEQSKIVMLEATNFQTLYERYPHKLLTKEAEDRFEYPGVWVGEDFAEEMGLKTGDTIEIYSQINERMLKMSVARIMYNQGLFADTAVHNVLIDIKNIGNLGMINTSLIKLKDPADYEEITAALKEHMQNDAITVEPAVDEERVERIVKNNTNLLNIALAFIMTIMILILFTSYLVVAKSRLNEMIIFKASGATPLQTTLIMLSEVLLYGIIGAAIGLFVGRVGMGIITKSLLPNFPGAVSYDIWKYVVAFFTGVLVSALSSIFPIIKISKKSIRELTSGIVKDVKYTKPLIIIILTILLGASLAVLIAYNLFVVYLTIAVIILFAFWIYFVTPYVLRLFSKIFSFFKGQSKLASISIKRNSSANTLTILVGAVVTFSFIVVSVISLIVVAITPSNSRYDTDYVISSTKNMEYESLMSDISVMEGVDKVSYYRTVEYERQIDDLPVTYKVTGISSMDAIKNATKGIAQKDMKRLSNTPHPIILNYDLAQRFDLKIGDTFTPQREKATATTTYNEILDYEYEVAAIDYSKTENDRVAYVLLEDMTYNGEIIEGDEEMIFIDAKEGANMFFVYLSLRDKVSALEDTYILRFDDWAYASSKGLEGVSVLLRFIQFLVSIVAFIGIVNLTIVTITDRKRELTVYKASGMSAQKYKRLSVFEGAIIGLSGGIIGIALSFFFNRLMPTFALIINKYFIYPIFPVEILFISLGAVIVYMAIYSIVVLANKRNFLKLSHYNERNL